MARDRIERAAQAAGRVVVRRPASQLEDALASDDFELVILDLDGGGPDLLAAVARAAPSARVVGYYSHVDAGLGDAARSAGCEAIPRGRFWRTLEEIVSL